MNSGGPTLIGGVFLFLPLASFRGEAPFLELKPEGVFFFVGKLERIDLFCQIVK